MLRVPKLETAAQTSDFAPDALEIALGADDQRKLTLSKPIRTHKGETRTIELREPTAADYIEIGSLPFDVRGDAADRRAVVDFKCAARWASRLTDLDEILIGQMAAPDWLQLVQRVNSVLMSAGLESVGAE